VDINKNKHFNKMIPQDIARLIFSGGRFSAKHALMHINSTGSCISSYILTDLKSFGTPQTTEEFLGYQNVELFDTGSEIASLPGKILKAKGIIDRYQYVVLCGVDDLIPDESLMGMPDSSSYSIEALAIAFGIDISYIPRTINTEPGIFAMPRFSLSREEVISQDEFWNTLAITITLEDKCLRVIKFYSDLSMFPFVYSIYNTKELLNFCRCFMAALRSCKISANSSFASILFEYTIITTSLIVSKIHFSNHIFRLNNYSLSSAGSDTYNYREIAGKPDELVKVYKLFQHFSSMYYINDPNKADTLLNLLYAGYMLASMQSFIMLKLSNQASSKLDLSSPYQRESYKYYLKVFTSIAQGRKITNMIKTWNE
jgi:hypothetical protein